jgi:hypothetical protein
MKHAEMIRDLAEMEREFETCEPCEMGTRAKAIAEQRAAILAFAAEQHAAYLT